MAAAKRAQATAETEAKHIPSLSFITVLNPNDSSLPSYRKAVRSHAAYYQHHHETMKTRESAPPKYKKRQKLKQLQLIPDESIVFTLSQQASSEKDGEKNSSDIACRQQVRNQVEHMTPGPRVPDLTYMPLPPELDDPQTPHGALRAKWFPLVMTEPATFQVIMLLAASHFASLQTGTDYSSNLLQMKSKAFSLIGPALAKDGPTDQLVGAVAKLASWEALFGDQASYEEHMKGLKKMVMLRGGLSELGLDGLVAKICVFIDSNASLLFNTPRHFIAVPENLALPTNPAGFLGQNE